MFPEHVPGTLRETPSPFLPLRGEWKCKIPNQCVRFWLTRVRIGSVNRCEMRSKEINQGPTLVLRYDDLSSQLDKSVT